MPSVSSNGPNWIRRQKARTDRDLEGLGPVRRFLAKLFGRQPPAAGGESRRSVPGGPEGDDRTPRAASSASLGDRVSKISDEDRLGAAESPSWGTSSD